MLDITGYDIGVQIYVSTRTAVYRAVHLTDDRPVILKVLQEAHPSLETIAQFRREYEITDSLDLTGVVDVYALKSDLSQWVMIVEDFGGDSLTQLGVAGQIDLDNFFDMAVELTDILEQVHQRQVTHKDINPANIVLNPNTGQLKLIDFGISTVLPRENPAFRNPDVLEGTLLYMSPEQTGRMNRSVDYRTDLYSLGVTFYELLTGCPPFDNTDPLEVVHAHLAKPAAAVHLLRPEIPPILSEIILKLMAKSPDARYQSARGLKADLSLCREQWGQYRQITLSAIAQADSSDRFSIPQKLCGRQDETEMLLEGFERVRQGTCEMILVAGHAGIGKSVLVQELYKPLTEQGGYFVSGKFEQFQRHTPYMPFYQAFRELIHHILTESDAAIQQWRSQLLDMLGANGKVLIDVIPELELIIGPQPVPPELETEETRNRFNLLLLSFILYFLVKEKR
ncbi:AAA family ATPase [Chloroflexi bacterium TSY]|nr:AAA family ATPase [Chloroflexi bacterium TSY]